VASKVTLEHSIVAQQAVRVPNLWQTRCSRGVNVAEVIVYLDVGTAFVRALGGRARSSLELNTGVGK